MRNMLFGIIAFAIGTLALTASAEARTYRDGNIMFSVPCRVEGGQVSRSFGECRAYAHFRYSHTQRVIAERRGYSRSSGVSEGYFYNGEYHRDRGYSRHRAGRRPPQGYEGQRPRGERRREGGGFWHFMSDAVNAYARVEVARSHPRGAPRRMSCEPGFQPGPRGCEPCPPRRRRY